MSSQLKMNESFVEKYLLISEIYLSIRKRLFEINQIPMNPSESGNQIQLIKNPSDVEGFLELPRFLISPSTRNFRFYKESSLGNFCPTCEFETWVRIVWTLLFFSLNSLYDPPHRPSVRRNSIITSRSSSLEYSAYQRRVSTISS